MAKTQIPKPPPAASGDSAASAKLDLNQAYGVVYGAPPVMFVQHGKQFDKTGKEILPRKQ